MDPFLLVYAVSASSSRVRRRIGLRCRDAFRLALVEGRKVSCRAAASSRNSFSASASICRVVQVRPQVVGEELLAILAVLLAAVSVAGEGDVHARERAGLQIILLFELIEKTVAELAVAEE